MWREAYAPPRCLRLYASRRYFCLKSLITFHHAGIIFYNYLSTEPRIDKCFEKARTKLDFLGIKWELPHRTLAKRSIYSHNHPSPIDHEIYYRRGRKSFTKRSEGSLKDPPAKTQITGTEWGLKPKEDSPKGKSRQPRSLEQFKIIFGANRFSDNMFQPVQDYHSRLEGISTHCSL